LHSERAASDTIDHRIEFLGNGFECLLAAATKPPPKAKMRIAGYRGGGRVSTPR
jgi:hypothetical protein